MYPLFKRFLAIEEPMAPEAPVKTQLPPEYGTKEGLFDFKGRKILIIASIITMLINLTSTEVTFSILSKPILSLEPKIKERMIAMK